MAEPSKKSLLTDREDALLDAIAGALRPFVQKLDKVEERLAKLEESKRLSYRGVYAPGERYEVGDYATHASSLWCCLRETSDMPGRSASWRLAAKG